LSPVKIIVFSEVEKLEEELANNKKLLFTVSATDAESGSTSVQRVIYGLNDIRGVKFGSDPYIETLFLEVKGNLRFPLDITSHGCPLFLQS